MNFEQLPQDRPLGQREQIEAWKQAMPEALRLGKHPSEAELSDSAYKAAWRDLNDLKARTKEHFGWLFNRLDFDREWIGSLENYSVPACCKPGAGRVGLAELSTERRRLQGIPPIRRQSLKGLGAMPADSVSQADLELPEPRFRPNA